MFKRELEDEESSEAMLVGGITAAELVSSCELAVFVMISRDPFPARQWLTVVDKLFPVDFKSAPTPTLPAESCEH